MLKIGTTITLEQHINDDQTNRFKCRVVEMIKNKVFIDYPINLTTGRTDIFPVGTSFGAFYVMDENAAYRFPTEIMGRKNRKVPMLQIHYDPAQVEKIQRREYVRVDANLDIALTDTNPEGHAFTSLTSDISGGGLAVNLPKEINIENDRVFEIVVVLRMDDQELHYIFAKTRAIRTHHKTDRQYPILSMEFVEIEERDRQRIIQFCFDTQLKQRRERRSRKGEV